MKSNDVMATIVAIIMLGAAFFAMVTPIFFIIRYFRRRSGNPKETKAPNQPQLQTEKNINKEELKTIATYFCSRMDEKAELKSHPKVIEESIKVETHIYHLEDSYYLSKDKEVIQVSEKKKSPGKLYINFNNQNLTVEDFAIKKLEEKGYSAIHTESSMWNVMWYLLYCDLYWLNIPSAQFHTKSDMPSDLYGGKDFFMNRKEFIINQTAFLLSLSEEKIDKYIQEKYEFYSQRNKSRIITADPKASTFTMTMVKEVLKAIGFKNAMPILLQLMYDNSEFRSGMPDIFAWHPENKAKLFCEVKSYHDKCSINQLYWMNKLQMEEFEVEIMRVVPDSKVEDVA